MKTCYLKVRMDEARYNRLKERAGERGERISTFANQLLVCEDDAIQQALELVEIKSLLQTLITVVQSPPTVSHSDDIHSELHMLKLLMVELAMDRNAQIMLRVAAKLKAESQNQLIERKHHVN